MVYLPINYLNIYIHGEICRILLKNKIYYKLLKFISIIIFFKLFFKIELDCLTVFYPSGQVQAIPDLKKTNSQFHIFGLQNARIHPDQSLLLT